MNPKSPNMPDHELEPIDPDHKPAKTMRQISAEHPEWKGLRQWVEMQEWEEAECTARRMGLDPDAKH